MTPRAFGLWEMRSREIVARHHVKRKTKATRRTHSELTVCAERLARLTTRRPPIVVEVKLPAMMAPNGLVGFWLRVGLIESAMNPIGFMDDQPITGV